MPLPSGVTTARVSFGQAVTTTGLPADLVFTVAPTHAVVHQASGVTIAPLADTFSAESGIGGYVDLPHTDQPGFVDTAGNPFTNWAYVIEGYWKRGTAVAPFRREFQIPRGQSAVDLDLIPEGETRPAVSAPTLVVTSINGQTGAVELDLNGFDPADLDEVRTEIATVRSASSAAASAAQTASVVADSAYDRAGAALSSAAQAATAASAVQTRVDALKPGLPGGAILADSDGLVPLSALPPVPGSGFVLAPIPGHPRYLTVVQ
jgi:hypothetical protein